MPSEQSEQVKYVDKLNISVTNIGEIKKLIKTNIVNTLRCWKNGIDIQRITFRIIGPAGVGKTEICKQIAEELEEETKKFFDCIVVKCPVISRDDYLIPFPIVSNGKKRFEMLYSDFVPLDDENSFGIYVIDEFSRGDHSLQQLMWQIQNEYKVHLKDLPKGWFVIAIDNPDDQEYSIDNLEDAAGLRRMLHLYVEVEPTEFINYAIKMKFHPYIIEFIQTHPDYLYDFQAQKIGSVYSNPASYEKLSDILKGYDSNGGVKSHLNDVEVLASGLLNVSMTRKFIEFVRDRKDVNPKDIVFSYNKVKHIIDECIANNNNAKLGEIMSSFMTYLVTSKPRIEPNERENLIQFLTSIPIDTAVIFITTTDLYPTTSNEFKYLTKLHVFLTRDDRYKTLFYEKLDQAAKG